jgi:hypothetical protein
MSPPAQKTTKIQVFAVYSTVSIRVYYIMNLDVRIYSSLLEKNNFSPY